MSLQRWVLGFLLEARADRVGAEERRMSHSCVLPGQMGSCVQLERGEYWLTLNSVSDRSISLAVDFCPFCGSRAGRPATLQVVALEFCDEW